MENSVWKEQAKRTRKLLVRKLRGIQTGQQIWYFTQCEQSDQGNFVEAYCLKGISEQKAKRDRPLKHLGWKKYIMGKT